MNKVTLLLVFLVLLHGCASISKNEGYNTDEALRSGIIGTWVPDPKDPDAVPSTSTYLENGSLNFVRYSDETCREVIYKARALWRVQGKKLYIVVQESGDTTEFNAGDEIVDEFIHMDSKSMILKGWHGNLQYRVKSNVCVYNEIKI